MIIALNVDYVNISATPEAVDNAQLVEEAPGYLVVNLHANYVINEAQRYTDRAFPHIQQMHEQFALAEKFGSLVAAAPARSDLLARPFRRPDFADEWQHLKKAWSLHMRGKSKLSDRQIVVGSEAYYSNDPLRDIADWVWRFCMFMGSTKYQRILMAMTAEIKNAIAGQEFTPLLAEYEKTAHVRARRYFDILREYFIGWSEFSQVHFSIAKGMPVIEGRIATTNGFNIVKMFYGSALEAFSSSVDILAFINNVLAGRDWAKFNNIDAGTYLRSDKSKRFECLTERPAFLDLCEERDSQLRNASHHGSLRFDNEAGILFFNKGKGNFGELVEISYTDYLARCSALFFQIVTLLRFELLICEQTRTRCPV